MNPVARIGIGAFLFVHYVGLAPYAAVLFSDEGMLPTPLLPSPLHGAGAATALVWTLTGLSISYLLGFATRTSGALLGLGALLLWQRNPLTLNPSLPFLGFWFLIQLLTPPDPPWSVDRRLSGRPAKDLPEDVRRVLWLVVGVAYTFSGWTKLVSPSWRDGEAVALLLAGPVGLDGPVPRWMAAWPEPMLALATWSVVALELSVAPLALVTRARPVLWWALLAMHAGLLVTVDLRDISWAMVAVHLVLFPSRGRPTSPSRSS